MSMRRALARIAAVLLGIGLGGFLDGIVLHQIAHWHQMLSAVHPPDTLEAIRHNMTADGWFHMATWLVTFGGVLALWGAAGRAGPLPSTRSFLGCMLLGWGAFNLVEGGINHHLLELHHVRDLPVHVAIYDWMFIVFSAGLLVAGSVLQGRRSALAGSPGAMRSN